MSIAAISPGVGTQIADIDRDLEAYLSSLVPDEVEPTAETAASPEPSDHDETKDGLIRLMDYLHRRRQERNRKPNTGNKIIDKVLRAYQSLEDMDETLITLGQNLDRRS